MAVVGSLSIVDLIVLLAYFLIVIGFGIWSSCRNRGSVKGYFLAGRSMHWLPVGASLFASNIGSGHFIGLAGSGASGGIGIAAFELNAIVILMLLGWLFVPVYIAAGVFTMPEYLRKRFGGQRIRIYLSCLTLILYIFTKVSADLYAGAIFIEQSLNFNLYLAVIILLAIAALFTILGGLTAVIWTDFVQTVIMLVGAVWLMIAAFVRVGGYQQLQQSWWAAVPNSTVNFNASGEATSQQEAAYAECGRPPSNSWHLLRAADDPGLPWPGIVFGLTISSVWYWCTDQVIVQRALAAKNFTHAKAGTVAAGWLKMLPLFLLVFPGMIARVLFPDIVGCSVPELCQAACGKRSGCTDMAYPLLVLRLLGDGARGLMMAVMLSSLVSSLTSIFNSASTIFTIDIWMRLRREATDTELMIVGRVFVVAMVAVAVVWIPIVKSGSELFHYIQAITSYLAPPVCAVFVAGVLWKRCNEQGAFWSLIVGFVVGMIRFIVEYSYPKVQCGESSTVPDIIGKVHYLHFGILLFGICIAVIVVVSLLTEPIDESHLHRLTFWSRHSQLPRAEMEESEANDCCCGRRKSRYDLDAGGKGGSDSVESRTNAAFSGSVPSVTAEVATAEAEAAKDSAAAAEASAPAAAEAWYVRAAKWICGVESQTSDSEAEDPEAAEQREKMAASLEEDKKWKVAVDISAIVLLAASLFMWIFFG